MRVRSVPAVRELQHVVLVSVVLWVFLTLCWVLMQRLLSQTTAQSPTAAGPLGLRMALCLLLVLAVHFAQHTRRISSRSGAIGIGLILALFGVAGAIAGGGAVSPTSVILRAVAIALGATGASVLLVSLRTRTPT